MKKLLMFVNGYSPKMETFIYNNIKDLADRGLYKVTVLCHFLPDPDFNIHPDIEVIHLDIKSSLFSRLTIVKRVIKKQLPLLKLLSYGRNSVNLSLLCLADKLHQQQFDIIHAHFGQNGQLLAQLKDAGLLKGKLITQFHGIDFTGKIYTKAYYTELAKHANKIIAVTEFSKSKLITFGFMPAQIVVLPVGSDSQPLAGTGLPLKKDDALFKILFVGRLIELKGIALLPQIANQLVENGIKGFKIIVVGDGPMRGQLETAQLTVPATLDIAGFNPVSKVKEIMSAADVLIYPGIEDKEGRVENQCVTVQEAMFMKLPVVASALGGLPETVIDSQTGYLTEPGNIEELVSKLITLYKDKALRKTFGDNAFKFALAKYDINMVHNQLLDLYQKA
jgi:colanic acid/amylovoran biosynthesis glycosyltransferase